MSPGGAVPSVRGIHWFRNDLRLQDNTALAALSERVEEWLPIFVLDPRIFSRMNSGQPRVRFLLDCLDRLGEELATRPVPTTSFTDPGRFAPWEEGIQQWGMAMGGFHGNRRPALFSNRQPDDPGTALGPRWTLCSALGPGIARCARSIHTHPPRGRVPGRLSATLG